MLARITIKINNNEKKNLSKNDYYGKEYLRGLDDSRLPFGTCNFMRTLFIDFLSGQRWRIDCVEFYWIGMAVRHIHAVQVWKFKIVMSMEIFLHC